MYVTTCCKATKWYGTFSKNVLAYTDKQTGHGVNQPKNSWSNRFLWDKSSQSLWSLYASSKDIQRSVMLFCKYQAKWFDDYTSKSKSYPRSIPLFDYEKFRLQVLHMTLKGTSFWNEFTLLLSCFPVYVRCYNQFSSRLFKMSRLERI